MTSHFDSPAEHYDTVIAESDLEALVKLDRQIEWYNRCIKAAEEDKAKRIQRLEAFAKQYRMTVGKSLLSLANGTITTTKRRERTEVYDQKGLEMFCLDIGFYEETQIPNVQDLKSKIVWEKDGKGYLHDVDEPGDSICVPGIRRIIPEKDDYCVKIEAGVKQITGGEEEEGS